MFPEDLIDTCRLVAREIYVDNYVFYIQNILLDQRIMNIVITMNDRKIKTWAHCTANLSVSSNVIKKNVEYVYRVYYNNTLIAILAIKRNNKVSVGQWHINMQCLYVDDKGFGYELDE